MTGSSDSQESFSPPGDKHTEAIISPEQVDLSQVYTLIDGILPFEACLYYQVLPLSIEGSRLAIGIVNPEDRAASDYVKKQLSYINYSLTFRTIQSDWHRDLLSKYLSHNAKTRHRSQQPSAPTAKPSMVETEKPAFFPLNDPGSQATFIVDQPEEIPDYVRSATARSSEPRLAEGLEDTLPTAPELPSAPPEIAETMPAEAVLMAENELADDEAPTIVSLSPAELSEIAEAIPVEETPTMVSAFPEVIQEAASPMVSPLPLSTAPTVEESSTQDARPAIANLTRAPVAVPESPRASAIKPATVPTIPAALDESQPLCLQIDEQYRHQFEALQIATLPPKALMQALLGRVLEEGIGRLYFERPGHNGRILWSKDGILQAVLESIKPQVFQGVINEFKLLTHLSLVAVKKPKQVEIERLYEGERILLRFRVMPSAHGEEATLQVLRGTALRFYQQQQIDKLGRDALDAAQALSRRLKEIRDRARQSLNFKATRSETLPAIIQLLKEMECQVQELVSEHGLTKDGRPAKSTSKGRRDD